MDVAHYDAAGIANAKPAETRFLKFVALDSFDTSRKPCASLAELNLILAGSDAKGERTQ